MTEAGPKSVEASGLADRAVAGFRGGYNCSEAVLITLAEHLGIKSDAIPAVASGFGGGIGRTGEICGAVAGGVMALGLAVGRKDPADGAKRLEASNLADELVGRFRRYWNSVVCRELIGFVLKDPGMQERYAAENIRENCCRRLVSFVAEECRDILERRERPSLEAGPGA